MPLGSLLLAAAMIILVGLFLARPLILSPNTWQNRVTARQELLAQKENLLAQIEILDFDYETGILPEQEYKQRRRQLVVQAADVLARLDEYADLPAEQQINSLEEEIETAIARLRQHQPQPAAVAASQAAPAFQSAPDSHPAPLPTPVAQPESTNGQIKFCAQCGQPIEAGDKFCAYCGHKLAYA